MVHNMALRLRRRGRGRARKSVSGHIRQYLVGFLFIALAAFIMGIVSYITSNIPASNLTFGSVSISNTVFLNIIAFAASIVLLISALAKFGIRV